MPKKKKRGNIFAQGREKKKKYNIKWSYLCKLYH